MIHAIAELGKYVQQKNPGMTNFDIWLEDSYDEKKYPHLLVIQFQRQSDGKWNFVGIDYRHHSSDLKSRLLYKRGASKGTDRTPTAKIAKSLEGTYRQKILAWFKDSQNHPMLQAEEKDFLRSLYQEMNQKSSEILHTLKEKSKGMQGGIVLSIGFGEEKFIGDYDFFSKFITEESKVQYYYSKTFKKKSLRADSICSICHKKRKEVYGYFTTLKFYNVDKPGMVSSGLKQENSWKNYPVCLDCALHVEAGIKLMEEELHFSFYGLHYYLIPKFIHGSKREEILDLIIDYKKSPTITDKDKISISNAENEVFDLLKDLENKVSFNLLFYDKPQKSVFYILASIEELLPSRLKKLFAAKKFVDDLVFFQVRKEGKKIFNFNFGALRTFFPNDRIEGKFDKSFLEMTQKIFQGNRIDYDFLLQYILRHLRSLFNKTQSIGFSTLQGFMLINFLNYLDLFGKKTKEKQMDSGFFNSFEIQSKEELDTKLENFFTKFEEFFITDSRKSIFLMGILCQFLLNIQKNERGVTPFRTKLKSLKMNSIDIVSLFPQIVQKLEEYKKNYYIPLENSLSRYLISAGDAKKWNIPIDEINFIFVLGMNLSNHFKVRSEENKTLESNQ